jgi:hypothetical protein
MLFCFVVFTQASIQRTALLVDAVTETLAGIWAVIRPAHIRAFRLFVAGPDVKQKKVEHNHGHGRCENTSEKQKRELASFYDLEIFAGLVKRQSVFQTVIVPNQQEQVRQQHERHDTGSIESRSMGQNENIQHDGEVEDRPH